MEKVTMKIIKTASYEKAVSKYSPDPWNVSIDSVGRDDKDKYEKCVHDIKRKSKDAITFDTVNLNSMEDRNRLNKRIKEFENIVSTVYYLKKYIYQNAPQARLVVGRLYYDKKMSSYPRIKELLKKAYIASRDNYKEFAQICDEIAELLYAETEKMRKARKEFVQKTLPERLKERLKG